MSGSRFGKLLVLTMSLLAVLGVSSLTAAASPSSPAAQKRLTGNVGVHYFRCFRKPPKFCRGPKGTRGLRGLTGKTGAAGNNGVAGPQGIQGVQGNTGPAGGTIGPSGSQGPTGVTGPRGSTGSKGTTGSQGARGVTGIAGTNGTNGSPGATGSRGPTGTAGTNGTNGSPGATGSRGPTGTAGTAGSGGVSQYAYIYNTSVETVAVESDVIFDSNGLLTSGFTHTVNTTGITVVSAGFYKVTFSVSGTQASQFALFVDGTLVPGTIYGSGAATQQNDGQAIFSIVAGGQLTLRNHTSNAAVGLPTIGGGTLANTNASVLIEKLG
jgi:hypothetical protein